MLHPRRLYRSNVVSGPDRQLWGQCWGRKLRSKSHPQFGLAGRAEQAAVEQGAPSQVPLQSCRSWTCGGVLGGLPHGLHLHPHLPCRGGGGGGPAAGRGGGGGGPARAPAVGRDGGSSPPPSPPLMRRPGPLRLPAVSVRICMWLLRVLLVGSSTWQWQWSRPFLVSLHGCQYGLLVDNEFSPCIRIILPFSNAQQ